MFWPARLIRSTPTLCLLTLSAHIAPRTLFLGVHGAPTMEGERDG